MATIEISEHEYAFLQSLRRHIKSDQPFLAIAINAVRKKGNDYDLDLFWLTERFPNHLLMEALRKVYSDMHENLNLPGTSRFIPKFEDINQKEIVPEPEQ